MKHARTIMLAVILATGGALLFRVLSAWAGAEQAVLLGSSHVDMWGTHWFYWMFEERLLRGEPFAHTDLLFFPWGKDVYLHTGGNVVDAMLALPFRWMLGDSEGYNAFVLFILLGNGLSGAWLCRCMGASPLAAGVTGVMASLQPFCLAELAEGRLTQALLIFPTLFLAEWLLLMKTSSRGRVIRAGLWLCATGLVYWYYAIFCGAVAGLVTLAQLWESRGKDWSVPWRGVLAAGGLALLLALPLAWPMLSALGAGEVPGLLAVDQWTLSTWEPITREGYAMGLAVFDPVSLSSGVYYMDEGVRAFLSPTRTVLLTPLVLGAIGLLKAPRRWRLALAASIILLFLLAVGPALGPDAVNPFYVVLAKGFPPLQRLWWPGRALGILGICLLPLVGWALSSLGPDWKVSVVGVGSLMLLGWELDRAELSPMPTSQLEIPVVVDCLAAGEGAIIDLPYGDRPERLLYQTVHGRARLGGMLEGNPVFVPETHARFLEDDPAMRALIGVTRGESLCKEEMGPECIPRPTEAELQALGDLGFSLVVVDRDGLGGQTGAGGRVTAERRARLQLREMLGSPVFKDRVSVVYQPWGGSFECEPSAAADGETP